MNFIHLRASSDYSLGKSIVKIPKLVQCAVANGMNALGLIEHNNLFGSLEFSMECLKYKVKPIIGSIIKVKNPFHYQNNKHQNAYSKLVVIAKNKIGYQNLLQIISTSYLEHVNDAPHIDLQYLYAHAEGVMLLFNCFDSHIAKSINLERFDDAVTLLDDMQRVFKQDLFLELIRTKSNHWDYYETWFLEQAFQKNIPLVATNPITFLNSPLCEAQDILLCIANSTYLLEEKRKKADPDHYFKSIEEMKTLFYDVPEAIENTELIAIKASIFPTPQKPMLPKFSTENIDEAQVLEQQALEGLKQRLAGIKYGIDQDVYFQRLSFELNVIKKMNFPGYFLIVSDFVKWSKNNNIPVGAGRGSGAGSIVAWALQITDLDPIKFGLLFERFLNPERVSMPDFDIDFCQERRDEVIQYVRAKYGFDRVAQIITFGKLQARAVLRDVGRVLQIPYNLIDKICKVVPNNPANPVTLAEAIALDKDISRMRQEEGDIAKLLEISLELEGINRHVSTHAAGVIIADRPLIEVVPLYQDANSSMPIVQYSLKYADAVGLMKFDFLGLKTLTVIAQTVSLIETNHQIKINVSNLDYGEQVTYQMLAKGESVGIFQFEGAGVKDALKQLRPDCLEDLIALTSLYRPGPMDNIPSYINRKHQLEKIDYIHPKLEALLKETYGIIIYQEQVMQIAQILAGYTLGEADLLRRAMGKKNKQEMQQQSAIFVARCVKNGLENKAAADIFNLIEKFASYGFNKSHAAAYAVISYQTAYLKCHYTAEFLTASMNLEINDTYKIGLFCQEAKKFHLKVLPPDITVSQALFTVENGNIRYGLAAIKGVGIKLIETIIQNAGNQSFANINEFFIKCHNHINRRALESMVKAGAFDSLYSNRAELFENIDRLLRYYQHSSFQKEQASLFAEIEEMNLHVVKMESVNDWSNRQKLLYEFEAIGFHLSSHPLDAYMERLKKMHIMSVADVWSVKNLNVVKCRIAGVIISKKIRSSAKGKYAFLQIADQVNMLDVTIFNEKVLLQNNDILQEGNVVILDLEIKSHEGAVRINVENVNDFYHSMQNITKCCRIYVKQKEEVFALLPLLKASGIPIKLYVELTEHIVSLDLQKKYYIEYQDIEVLRNGIQMKILEE